MAQMLTKIKNLFSLLGRTFVSGFQGFFGVVFIIFACIMLIGLFTGDVNLQKFIYNEFVIVAREDELEKYTKKLDELKLHNDLIITGSPDYLEEIGLKQLNKGTPDTKILKI